MEWNAFGRKISLVEEDATKVILIGEDIVLSGEIGTTGVDEVHAGEVILLRDFLCAQVLLDRDWVVRAALDSGVVRDNDAEFIVDETDTCDDTASRDFFLSIEIIPGELRELHEWAARVEQLRDTFSHGKFATFLELRMRVLWATLEHFFDDLRELIVDRFRSSHIRLIKLAVLIQFHAQRRECVERLRVRRSHTSR